MNKRKTGTSSSIKKELEKIDEFFKKIKPKNQENPVKFAFAITLISQTVSKDWVGVQANLSKTLISILENTDQNFEIIIAGHEKPNIDELNHNKVTWLQVDFPPPINSGGFGRDRKNKRIVIGEYLRNMGFSGYFMPLDADDWVHYRFVEFIRSHPFSDAFIINKGFMVNQKLKEAWVRNRFYRGCGSSAIYYFSNSDFPITATKEDARKTPFVLVLQAHAEVPQNLKNVNKNYTIVNFPFVTYFIGHGVNWSNKDGRVSAKKYKAKGEKLENWFYHYFKI